jgi:excinuclease UvrABC nuclease subunit
MPVAGDAYQFTKPNVERAPETTGVYELSRNGEVIYIGRSSQDTIRNRLQRHQRGDEGRCTQEATHYKRETTTGTRAVTYEAELLAEYRKRHGKLPHCNERAA